MIHKKLRFIGCAGILFTSIGCVGRHFVPRTQPCRGKVILFRGLWDVFSLGLDDLAQKAAEDGFNTIVARGTEWRSVADHEAAALLIETETSPLIVGGHSYGADNAVRFCEALKSRSMEVDLLLLLDATNPPPIPANVRRCLHVYKSSILGTLLPGVFAGNPVRGADSNNRTEIENFQVTQKSLGSAAHSVGHFSIDANNGIHQLCLNKMNQVCQQRRVRADADLPAAQERDAK